MHFTYYESIGLTIIVAMIIFIGWNIRKALYSPPQPDSTEVPRFWRIIPQSLIAPQSGPKTQENHLYHISGRVRGLGEFKDGSRGSLQVTILKWVKRAGKPYLRTFKTTRGSQYYVKDNWIYFTISVEAYTVSSHVYFPIPTVGAIEFDEPGKVG